MAPTETTPSVCAPPPSALVAAEGPSPPLSFLSSEEALQPQFLCTFLSYFVYIKQTKKQKRLFLSSFWGDHQH
jgi:hypothetical protein